MYGGAGSTSSTAPTVTIALVGGIGNDLIFGDDGDDTLLGDDGRDAFLPGTGSDLVRGGAGGDQMIADETVDHLDQDTVATSAPRVRWRRSNYISVAGNYMWPSTASRWRQACSTSATATR